ncbi:MAG: murein biosynthesis integral membrane protein MurJ, partial [Ilumatobacteraceae bacterium]
ISALLGFARDVTIAATFGAGAALDAYLVAQGLLNVVLGLLASAMAKASVPVIARGVDRGEVRSAHRTAAVALSVTTMVLALASLVMWLAAAPVLGVLAPGFDGVEQELAVRLTRIVLIASVFVAGTNLLAAVAQAHRRFFWAGVQGVPFNVVMIVAATVFGPRFGVAALAVGYVVASAARFVAQLVPLRAIGFRITASLQLRDRGFREMVPLLPALLIGSAVGNVNTLVDRAVGSTVGEGTIAALSYGWRVAALGELLLVAPLVTALYPALGVAAAGQDLGRLVHRGLSAVAVILTPVAIVLVVLATPLVMLAFQRGSFDSADVERTAVALAFYAAALVALGWREVLARAFYAVGDARSPVLVAVAAMVVNVVGDLTIGYRFGIPGLALSTTLALVFAAFANTVQFARRHRALAMHDTLPMVARVGLAAVVGTLLGLLATGQFDERAGESAWRALVEIWIGLAAVGAGFLGTLALVRAPELAVLGAAVRRVVRRGDRADA